MQDRVRETLAAYTQPPAWNRATPDKSANRALFFCALPSFASLLLSAGARSFLESLCGRFQLHQGASWWPLARYDRLVERPLLTASRNAYPQNPQNAGSKGPLHFTFRASVHSCVSMCG